MLSAVQAALVQGGGSEGAEMGLELTSAQLKYGGETKAGQMNTYSGIGRALVGAMAMTASKAKLAANFMVSQCIIGLSRKCEVDVGWDIEA